MTFNWHSENIFSNDYIKNSYNTYKFAMQIKPCVKLHRIAYKTGISKDIYVISTTKIHVIIPEIQIKKFKHKNFCSVRKTRF